MQEINLVTTIIVLTIANKLSTGLVKNSKMTFKDNWPFFRARYIAPLCLCSCYWDGICTPASGRSLLWLLFTLFLVGSQ